MNTNTGRICYVWVLKVLFLLLVFTAWPSNFVRAQNNAAMAGWVMGLKPGDTALIHLSGPKKKTASTKPGGKWRVDGLAPGAYVVTIEKQGYRFQPDRHRIKVSSGLRQAVNFRAIAEKIPKPNKKKKGKLTVSGRVFGLQGGDSINLQLQGSTRSVVTTNPGGTFKTDLAPGKYKVTAVNTDPYRLKPATKTVYVKDRPIHNLRFDAHRQASKSLAKQPFLQVTIKGIPPGKKAIVKAKGAKTYSEAIATDGVVKFWSMQPGRYQVKTDIMGGCKGCGYLGTCDITIDISKPGDNKLYCKFVRL